MTTIGPQDALPPQDAPEMVPGDHIAEAERLLYEVTEYYKDTVRGPSTDVMLAMAQVHLALVAAKRR